MIVQCKNQTKIDFKDLFFILSRTVYLFIQEFLIFERFFYWNFTYSPLFQLKWKLEINIAYQTSEFCSEKFYDVNNLLFMLQC